MSMMSEAMHPLRSYPEFISILQKLENPFAGIVAGLVFTALVQSSSAFTGIVIVLAQQNLITLEAGVPMIIGANIGTCVTAGLASIGATREAKRVALAHTFINIGGALLFIFWIPSFVDLITSFDDYLGGGTARQVANAHTVFNIGAALFFLPFTALTAKLMMKIMPAKEEADNHLIVKHLDPSMIKMPVPAIDLAVAEISRASEILEKMLQSVIIPFTEDKLPNDKYHPKLSLMQGLSMREEEIDFLEKEIADFLLQISRQDINTDRMREVFGLISIINDIESIGDIISGDIIRLIDQKQVLESDFSEEGKEELIKYHVKISKQLSRMTNVFTKKDSIRAVKILVKGEKYSYLETKYRDRHFTRIQDGSTSAIITHKVHIDLFDSLKQIGVYLENMAKTIAETSPFEE